ncbi:MAG: hypothetical protein NVS2B16_27160 [Chloroflexota bacterium]
MPPGRHNRMIQAQLSTLHRRDDLVLDAGIQALSGAGDGEMRPHIALWMNPGTAAIVGYGLFVAVTGPGNASEAADALLSALLRLADPATQSVADGVPDGAEHPPLPGHVRVSSEHLGTALAKRLEPLGVSIEVISALPALEQTFAVVSDYLGEDFDDVVDEPFVWDVAPQILEPLYQAGLSLARHAPWEYMDDTLPLAVALGEDGPRPGAGTVYAVILGAGDPVKGMVFYDTLQSYERTVEVSDTPVDDDEAIAVGIEHMRRAGVAVDAMAPEALNDAVLKMIENFGPPPPVETEVDMQDAMIVYLDRQEDVNPGYVQWLRDRGLPVASHAMIPTFSRTHEDGEHGLLSAREARALTLALEAVNGFLTRFALDLRRGIEPDEPLIAAIEVVGPGGPRTVEVCWPGTE